MSANRITSRLCDQSAGQCKNCWPVPIGYTDNSLECADLSVRAILTITFTCTYDIVKASTVPQTATLNTTSAPDLRSDNLIDLL